MKRFPKKKYEFVRYSVKSSFRSKESQIPYYNLEKVSKLAWLEHRTNLNDYLHEYAFLVELAVAPLIMDPDF